MIDAAEEPAMRAMFNPRSIALIGASASPERIGGRALEFLKRYGYAGAVYPVNPASPQIQGFPAFRRIEDVPDAVDLAVISVPAAHVLDVLRACAAKGVALAIVYSSGFAEVGDEGAATQAQMAAIAKQSGMRILGPNCLGMMSVPAHVYCTFSAAPDVGIPSPGGIGIVSQSGAFGAYAFADAVRRGLPISRWITTGNEADIEVADCIRWLADDPESQLIMAYMEGCRDRTKFAAALERARSAGKPVILMKVGRTQTGAAATLAHTAAISGDDGAFDAVVRRHGAYRALSMQEFFDVGYAWLKGVAPRGRRIGILTASGGAGALLADAAEDFGLSLPQLPPAVQAGLKAAVPFAGTRNPVDVTGQVSNDPTLFPLFFARVAESGQYDAILCFQALAGINPLQSATLTGMWRGLRERYPGFPVFACLRASKAVRSELEDLKIPLFDDPTRMVAAVAGLCRLRDGSGCPAPEKPGDLDVLRS